MVGLKADLLHGVVHLAGIVETEFYAVDGNMQFSKNHFNVNDKLGFYQQTA